MKISKKQLKMIIREEKNKLLKESITDMGGYQNAIYGAAQKCTDTVVDFFVDTMDQLFQEDPEIFDGRSTEAEWDMQIQGAAEELEEEIQDLLLELKPAIEKAIERVEMMLHDGQYG